MSAGEQEGVPELLRAARAVYHPSVGAGGGLGSWGGQEAGSEMTGGGKWGKLRHLPMSEVVCEEPHEHTSVRA